jgi:hypothetical protein
LRAVLQFRWGPSPGPKRVIAPTIPVYVSPRRTCKLDAPSSSDG